ncbi:uncharacterized protein [Miscanthus floridulus]|uniref:uncharacterized protein n=1 Tax=Miscanthus floridulus TaxID=154761 RepID=UPI00345A81E5
MGGGAGRRHARGRSRGGVEEEGGRRHTRVGAGGVKEASGDAGDMEEVVAGESTVGSREEMVWETRRRRGTWEERDEREHHGLASLVWRRKGRLTRREVNALETGRDRGGMGGGGDWETKLGFV